MGLLDIFGNLDEPVGGPGAYGLLSKADKLNALFAGLAQMGAGMAQPGQSRSQSWATGLAGLGQGMQQGNMSALQMRMFMDKYGQQQKRQQAVADLKAKFPHLAPVFDADPERAVKLAFPDPKDRYMAARGLGVVDVGGDKPTVSLAEPKTPPSSVQEYEHAVSQGYKGSLLDYQTAKAAAGRSNVSLKVDGSPNFGTIPPGHMMQKTADGWQMVPVPGSPAALEQEQKRRAEGEGRRQQLGAADVVSQDAKRVIELMDKAVIPTTGAVGSVAAKVGGTAAHDVSKLLETVKANTAFDKIAEMRKASPTGAALGQVTEKELALLGAVQGNLEQSQSDEQLRRNVIRLHNTWLDVVHGPGQGPGRIAEQAGGKGMPGAPPAGKTPRVVIQNGMRFDADSGEYLGQAQK